MRRCFAAPRRRCSPRSVSERAASLRLCSVGSERRTVLVAPAWPYANGPRHIGHVAGFAVPADVLARFERFRGSRVLMASGTDEHATPITYESNKQCIPPRELVDKNSALFLQHLPRTRLTPEPSPP